MFIILVWLQDEVRNEINILQIFKLLIIGERFIDYHLLIFGWFLAAEPWLLAEMISENG